MRDGQNTEKTRINLKKNKKKIDALIKHLF